MRDYRWTMFGALTLTSVLNVAVLVVVFTHRIHVFHNFRVMSLKTFKLLLLLVSLTLVAQAATSYKILHTFKPRSADAWNEDGNVLLVNNALYGVSYHGGGMPNNYGTVWKYDLATNKESVLHAFTGPFNDGEFPMGLMWDGTTFYGTTQAGGSNGGCGTIFSLDTTGKETVLYNFQDIPDGCGPAGGVVKDAQGNLYGVTTGGGDNCNGFGGCGTVYKFSGGVVTVLHAFQGGADEGDPQHTTPVLDSSDNLFGVAGGGLKSCNGNGCGFVYEVSNGGVYSVFYQFHGVGQAGDAGLTIDANNTLYGALFPSAVYSLTSSGQETETKLAAGQVPTDVTLDTQGNLYIVCKLGGPRNDGVLRKLSGGHLTTLHNFLGRADGIWPYAPVVIDSSGTIYGTTWKGGLIKKQANGGVLYRVKP
jgi:uncharacterized repeat protein (TIGR03803 family)